MNDEDISRLMGIFMLLAFLTAIPLCSGADTFKDGFRSEVPMLVGRIDMGAPISGIRVTPDSKRAVVLVTVSGSQARGIKIIDMSIPQKPVVKGLIPASGKMALSV